MPECMYVRGSGKLYRLVRFPIHRPSSKSVLPVAWIKEPATDPRRKGKHIQFPKMNVAPLALFPYKMAFFNTLHRKYILYYKVTTQSGVPGGPCKLLGGRILRMARGQLPLWEFSNGLHSIYTGQYDDSELGSH